MPENRLKISVFEKDIQGQEVCFAAVCNVSQGEKGSWLQLH